MNMIVAGTGYEGRTHQHEEDPAAGGHRQTDTGGRTQEHGETVLVGLKPVYDFIMSAKSHNCFDTTLSCQLLRDKDIFCWPINQTFIIFTCADGF